ncbi:MAG: hypothetical protein PWQ22_460 [Archaeoglobaceae archaeon]|nr:hypothetical protein [Archaeoglobaceae archaeon]
MKSLLEEKIEEIAKKLDEILGAVSILQQNLIQLSVTLEAINRKAVERELLSWISSETEDYLKKFREGRLEDCELKEFCTKRVEKAAMRILQTVAKNGTEEGLKELRMHIDAIERHSGICKDEKCLKNAVEVFKILEKLIESSEQRANLGRELIWGISYDGLKEEKVAEKISAISNAVRIKILKILARGAKSYAELERETGLKGGHLHFHLKNLISAEYVIRNSKGYAITGEGLRILKLLSDLKD